MNPFLTVVLSFPTKCNILNDQPTIQKAMSLPTVQEVRNRIEQIPDRAIQICYKTTFLMCARIGEIICLKYPTDKTAHPTGSQLQVKLDTYTPDLNNPREFQTLVLTRTMQGQKTSLTTLAKIKEPVAVFTVYTEKRGGWQRLIALPIRKEYEPWTQDILWYIKEQQTKPLFPFTRQKMYNVTAEIFKDLHYRIFPYKRVRKENSQIIKDSEGKSVRDDIAEHSKPFRNHGLRHLRNVDLRDFYGLSAEERSAYGGWTLSSAISGISTSIDRYGEAVWRTYFPKLMKPRS